MMKSPRLELFWAEKIKITQFMIHTIDDSSMRGTHTSSDAKQRIGKLVLFLIQNDRRFLGYLNFSIRLSLILPFSPISDMEIEKDLLEARDIYPAPALPQEIDKIFIRRAESLDWEQEGVHSSSWEVWKATLIEMERILSDLSDDRESRSRYCSLRGLRSLVGGVNSSTAKNWSLFDREIRL